MNFYLDMQDINKSQKFIPLTKSRYYDNLTQLTRFVPSKFYTKKTLMIGDRYEFDR